MSADDDLGPGIRGSIEFDCDGKRYTAEGAVLQFNEKDGVNLTWTGDAPWQEPLPIVRGLFPIGAVAIPDLRMKARQSNAGGDHYTYFGTELYSGYGVDEAYNAPVKKAYVPVPMLHIYLHRQLIQWSRPTMDSIRYEARTIRLPLGRVAHLAADCNIIVEALSNSSVETGARITPLPGVELIFEEPAPANERVKEAMQVKEFFELLLYRPNEEDYLQLHAERTQLRFRRSLETSVPSMPSSIPWELPIRLCEEYLPTMLAAWLGRFQNSRAIDHLQRLMRYPNLPLDMRYFMAFTALGLLTVETTHGKDPRKKVREIEHLRTNAELWRLLLSEEVDEKVDRYWVRLAETRHDFAHLSKPPAEVLTERKDLGRAMMQLVCIARARLFKHLGLPDDHVVTYMRGVRAQLDKRYGLVPDGLFK